jgi:hypothetical protein
MINFVDENGIINWNAIVGFNSAIGRRPPLRGEPD